MRHLVKRRRIVALFGVVAAGAVGVAAAFRPDPTTPIERQLALKLRHALDPFWSLRPLGELHLADLPARLHAGALVQALSGEAAPQQLLSATDDELRAMTRERIAKDYESAPLVNVRGWLLSPTEASLCALSAALD